MMLLNISGLHLSFGTREVLKNISFQVREGEKIGIVGVNGAGKTSLLKMIAQETKQDAGEFFVAKGLSIGYLKQEDAAIKEKTLLSAVLEAYSALMEMENELEKLEAQMSQEAEASIVEALMHRYGRLRDTFERQGGFTYKSKSKGILKGLGFDEAAFEIGVNTLSGGQRTRLMMARLLSSAPDLLLLDEPTNHLDMTATAWLEGFLSDYPKACIFVSHDRFFLDKVCTDIFEVENGAGTRYKGNYSQFVEKKTTDREHLARQFENQQKEIQRMEAFVEQQRRWNREHNIIAAESRLKAIERMAKVEGPQALPQKISFSICQNRPSGQEVLFVENLAVAYDQKFVFKNLSMDVRKGDRLFILGPNGCGKSSLMKALVSKVRTAAGQIHFGHHVDWAYYDQDFSGLDPQKSLYDELIAMDTVVSQTEMRNLLAAFQFQGDDVFKKVSVLSGGEKGRLLLAKLMLQRPNLLLMDEPTNHLDIHSREVLEDALKDYAGTVVCVSHDRYFINKLASRILSFETLGMLDFRGNYADFLNYQKNLKMDAPTSKIHEVSSESKEKFIASKEQKAKERKYKKMVEDTEKRIEDIEKRLSAIELQMQEHTVQSDHSRLTELYQEQEYLNKDLEEKLQLWESLLSSGEC